MFRLFVPIGQLLNKMKYAQKFILIGGILAIPIIFTSTMLTIDINRKIEQMTMRNEGIEYNLILKDLLKVVQQTRGLTVSFVSGNTSVQDEITSRHTQITNTLEELHEFEANLTNSYGMEEQMKKIESQWSTIKSKNWQNDNEVLTNYSALTEQIIGAMNIVTNNTGLLLADTKESYNLINSVSSTIPNLTESLGKMRANGMKIAGSKSMTDEQYRVLNNLFIQTTENLKKIEADLNIAFGNPSMKSALEENYLSFSKQSDYFLNVVTEEMLLTSTISMEPDQYWDIATTTIDVGLLLYEDSLSFLSDTLTSQLEELKFNRILMLSFITSILLLSLYMFVALYMMIKKVVNELGIAASDVANGNLATTVSFHTKDEMHSIEISFNKMVESLNELVKEITVSSEYVASSSEELRASAEETTASIEHVSESIEMVVNGTKVQTARIIESTQSLGEMSDGIQLIAENSNHITALTKETESYAIDGNQSVTKTVEQMTTIQATVSESSKIIQGLSDRSQEVGNILSMITDIAEQTNLLALNASIEAARAGEHGKGFAIVAQEVKKLAEQSRASTIQISELIATIQKDTMNSVKAMRVVNENVEHGIHVTEETAQKFVRILESMKNLGLEMEEISATSEQMSAGTQEVVAIMNEIMGELVNMSEQNLLEVTSSTEEQLAKMEEVLSSTVALSELAMELQHVARKFRL
ncbi:hypothetical protein I6G82_21990 [Lysinibacillus macroides]|uniref:methyl-accepting chemotaxis protein n=1 Tax=Lysinibacillus macroides TaxID=33935 RepID=UPI0006B62800|nr:methyl-accepting chemotaxis protein [Lysinibacillus macroides]QPR67815.1 hypothetical protein I6G82_21990 [Lysinibacillus macroides]